MGLGCTGNFQSAVATVSTGTIQFESTKAYTAPLEPRTEKNGTRTMRVHMSRCEPTNGPRQNLQPERW